MTFVKLEDAVKAVEDLIWPNGNVFGRHAIEALRSLPTDDGVTDEMVERAARAIRTLENGSDDFDSLIKHQGQKIAGAVLQSLRTKARAALQAALGPLPAPPSD